MPTNVIEKNYDAAFAEWTIGEILKAKAKWLHICYATIMPKELYEKAAGDNALRDCTAWAKREGYALREYVGETHLVKGPLIIGRFKPVLKGEKEDRHLEFDCTVLGAKVDPTPPQMPTLN